MQCIPFMYHNCLKYIHEGVANYVHGDDNPYSHCNTTYFSNDIVLPSTHIFMMLIPKNEPLMIDSNKNDNISSNVSK